MAKLKSPTGKSNKGKSNKDKSTKKSARTGSTLAAAAANDALAPRSTASIASADGLPTETQLQVDVHICLLDAMTDHFPIRRTDIGPTTVPSKPPIGADAQGWGSCLASFGEYLRRLRQIYGFYVHKPRYTDDTLSKPFPDIVLYLKTKLVGQFEGKD